MKNFFILVASLCVFVIANGQTTTTIWSENFNDSLSWSTTFPQSGWTLIDSDGDTYNWYYSFYSDDQDGYMMSKSYDSQAGALTPNNWMIPPAFDLTTVESNATVKFKFTTCPTANGASYRLEHYGVFVSTTNTQVGSFSMLFEETFTTDMTNWVWLNREVDLSNYIGQTIYIAIRHWNCTDMNSIAINDFVLEKTVPQSINQPSQSEFKVYPNPTSDYINIVANNLQKVEIYNSVGQIVSTSFDANQINVENIDNGVYTLKIYADNKVETQKLLINK